jgi:pSer/pThr/pTyr-binding forkhead associated (FHA) protein
MGKTAGKKTAGGTRKRTNPISGIAPSMDRPSEDGMVLRIVSGDEAGRQLTVRRERALMIGRSLEADVPLVDSAASRLHARLWWHEDRVWIEDLHSSNGTLVNGAPLRRPLALAEGDLFVVGTTRFRVASANDDSDDDDLSKPISSERLASRLDDRETVRGLIGSLDAVALSEVLRLLASNGKTGVLLVRAPGCTGQIHLSDGKLVFASIDGEDAAPRSTALRMLAWRRGSFELLEAGVMATPAIDISVHELLLEAAEAEQYADDLALDA